MEQLIWVVQVKWPNRPVWENIAAFDCEEAAMNYAGACRGKPLLYRVLNMETGDVRED